MSHKRPSEIGTIPQLDPQLVGRLLRNGINVPVPRQERLLHSRGVIVDDGGRRVVHPFGRVLRVKK
ncbi:MAG TPA: hypothetical protein VEY87_14155 [Gaiellaceae bacterium]|jgi:hypothetical protein|nr:hypothetical protein [Gaiellaceae bacterium]